MHALDPFQVTGGSEVVLLGPCRRSTRLGHNVDSDGTPRIMGLRPTVRTPAPSAIQRRVAGSVPTPRWRAQSVPPRRSCNRPEHH